MAKELKYLGRNDKQNFIEEEAELDVFENKNSKFNYLIPLFCSEFTTLCPITGQPDFAKFEIVYVPEKLCLESKSLKLYLFSFRNKGNFHEDVANKIFQDIWIKLKPKYMRLWADFSLRGGISIKPMIIRYKDDLKEEERKEIEMLVENYDRKINF